MRFFNSYKKDKFKGLFNLAFEDHSFESSYQQNILEPISNFNSNFASINFMMTILILLLNTM